MSDESDDDLAKLRFFRNRSIRRAWAGSRSRLTPRDADAFTGDGIADAFARELCLAGAIPAKELFEATEVFAAARKRVRAPVVADLCAGHGLAGVLFALMERDVERVVLVDRTRPESADVLLDAADRVAPWVRPKIEWRVERLARTTLEPGTSVVAIHACGLRTDESIRIAMEANGAVAVLPCCRPHRLHPAPEGLKLALGPDVAIDVHRTYALEERGYRVRWIDIDDAITPMHRVLVAAPATAATANGTA